MDKRLNIKKILIGCVVFVIIGVIITCTILIIVNDVINKVNNSSAIVSTSVSKIDYEYDINESLNVIEVDKDSKFHHITYDNKYIVYLKNNYLEIVTNLNSNNNIYDRIETQDDIVYFDLDSTSNNIIYITKSKSNILVINIYNIDDKISKKYNEVSIENFSEVKKIQMNLKMDVMYINVEIKTLTSINNVIYRLDLKSLENTIITDKLTDNMLLLSNNDEYKLYYIDIENNVYVDNEKVKFKEENILDIIGIDKENNIYLLGDSVIYKLKDNKITEQIMLTDSDLISYYSNNGKVYLIYPTYIMDVSSNNKYQRIYKLTNDVSFVSIVNDIIYLKSKNKNIMWKKIN